MANEQNLKPFNTLTEKEQRTIQRQGGIASGKVRREKARLRKAAEQLADMPISSEKNKKVLLEMGFSADELTNDKLLLLGLFQAATVKGNVEAFKEYKKLLGEEDVPNNDTLDKLDEVLEKIGGNI